MNYFIFTAVITACMGIGGHQHKPIYFNSATDGLGNNPYYNPSQLNSPHSESWTPLVSPHSKLTLGLYIAAYYVLTYFAGSFGRYNVHAKVFCWVMTIYPILTALTGLQMANLVPYISQVIPTLSGYYTWLGVVALTRAAGAVTIVAEYLVEACSYENGY